jgi:simple sugar transport system permease protein
MFGSTMAGLGGAFLVTSYVGSFADGMTGGVGWIAVAVVIFAGWSVKGVLAGSLLFGVANSGIEHASLRGRY